MTIEIDEDVFMPERDRVPGRQPIEPHIRKLIAITGHNHSPKASAKDWSVSLTFVYQCMKEFPNV